MDEDGQSAATTVVTLIHGTFARSAPWTQDGSTFRKELARLQGPVTFRPFEWTGANSHNARIAAGVQLGKHIPNAKTVFPEARHVLIAHSHGGNVAFYSLRDVEVKEAICGIVTMGTPFITCELRSEHTVVGVFRYLFATLTFVVSFGLLEIGYDEIKSHFLVKSEKWMLVATATILAVTAWKLILGPARRWFGRAGNRVSVRLKPSCASVPCLAVHTPLDEAGLVLSTARQIATVPFYLSNELLGMLPAILGTSALLLGLGEVVGFIMDLGGEPSTTAKAIMAVCAILLFACLVAIPVGMAAIPPLARGHPMAFGWERIIDNLTVDIGTSVHPSKQKHLLDHTLKFSSSARRGGLRHSSLYQDPIVIEHIAQWMSRLASATADNVPSVPFIGHQPSGQSKAGTWTRRAFASVVVFSLFAIWASSFLESAYATYADPTWRSNLPDSREQIVHSETVTDVHSKVTASQSWVLSIQVPNYGNCRISGFYFSDLYGLNLNVESGFSLSDMLSSKAGSVKFKAQSNGLTFKEGRKRHSFDFYVEPGKQQLRLWMLDFSKGQSTNFHMKAQLNCWSGDVAFVSQSWPQQIASLDLSPLGLPYPLW